MRTAKLMVILGMGVWLSACSRPDLILSPTNNIMVRDAKQMLDRSLATSVLNSTTPGSYVRPTRGALFKPVEPLDSRNAIVYIYRPHDKWNEQELQAPSFFVNGQRVYGLKDNGYFWLELPAGKYYLMAKRPLSLFHVKTIFDTAIEVTGGQQYFFRYDELSPKPKYKKPAKVLKPGEAAFPFGLFSKSNEPWDDVHIENGLVQAWPLMQRPADMALQEIRDTRLEDPGKYFDYEREPVWKPFDLYPDDANVQYGLLEITDPHKRPGDKFTPVTGVDMGKVQNTVDRRTRFLPDWMQRWFK